MGAERWGIMMISFIDVEKSEEVEGGDDEVMEEKAERDCE